MTIFNPPGQPAPQGDTETLQGGSFFPPIDIARFTAEMRVASQVTPERTRAALIDAMIQVESNADLIVLVSRQVAVGITTLEDVASTDFGGEHKLAFLYRRAVFCYAKHLLDEQYRDNGMTAAGEARAEGVDVVVGSHLRNARNAISDLVGRPRATIELL
jgi:hypothetical protein